MTSLAQAFVEGVRWRESQANNGIVHDRYLKINNPYEEEETMTEPTVPVPVSLIERAAKALLEVPPSSANASIYSDLSALLSQPTPPA